MKLIRRTYPSGHGGDGRGPKWHAPPCSESAAQKSFHPQRTRTNTNPNGTEANAAGRTGNARALRKQSKCGMIQEGEGH